MAPFRSVGLHAVWWAAIAGAALPAAACATVLGVDGEYDLEEPEGPDLGAGGVMASAGGRSAPGGASSGGAALEAGGAASSGGRPAGDGGTPGGTGGQAGGSSGGDDAGSGGQLVTGGAPGAGGAPTSGGQPAVGPCRPGEYSGTVTGDHQWATTVVGVPAPVTGTFRFTVAGDDGGPVRAVRGDYTCEFTAFPMTADIVATVDCATGELTGALENGSIINPFTTTFSGTFSGHLPVSGNEASGDWITVQPPPSTMDGSGTWSASRGP